MSGWRWLLFAVMSRFETAEDKYLRIPNAKTVGRDILLDEVSSMPDPSETAIE